MSFIANKRTRAVCCSLFPVVSTWCEAATSLRTIRYFLAVLLFQLFWQRTSGILNGQFRQQPSPLEPRAGLTKDLETLQQRLILIGSTKSCLFQLYSKQRETERTTQLITPGDAG